VKLEPKSLRSRNSLRPSNEKIVLDVPNNLKTDNACSESSAVNSQQQSYIPQSRTSAKLGYLDPIEGTLPVETSRDHRFSQRMLHKAGTAYISDIGECDGRKDSCKTQDFSKSKVQTIPKILFIDPYVLTHSDSWYRQRNNEDVDTVNRKVFQVGIERDVIHSEKICSVNTSECPDFRSQCIVGNMISNNGIFESKVRSMWL